MRGIAGQQPTATVRTFQAMSRHRSACGCAINLCGALYQVSETGSDLGVAVGDGSRRRCAECDRVERQRLQWLQQPERRCRRLLRCSLLRRRRPLRLRMIRKECRRLREAWLRAGETVPVGSRTRLRRACMYAGAVITTLTYMHMHICTYMTCQPLLAH